MMKADDARKRTEIRRATRWTPSPLAREMERVNEAIKKAADDGDSQIVLPVHDKEVADYVVTQLLKAGYVAGVTVAAEGETVSNVLRICWD